MRPDAPTAPFEPSHGAVPPSDPGATSGSTAGHVLRFVLALIGYLGTALGVMILVIDASTRELYGSEAAQEAAIAEAMPWVFAAEVAWLLVAMGAIARLAGYRVRDALFVFVPIYTYVFQVKMLWRWTGLPGRPWDPTSPTPTATFVATSDAFAPPAGPAPQAMPTRRRLRTADPFIAAMLAFTLVAVWLVVSSRTPVDDVTVAATDGWRTVRARGMTIDVPSDWAVNTDPAEAVRMLREAGGADDAADVIEAFPDFFVLMAIEPTISEGSSIGIFRYPSGGVPLRRSVKAFVAGAEDGGFELVSRERTTVGTGADPAVRLDWTGGTPPGPSTDYVVDGGTQVWMVGFVMPVGGRDEMTPIIDRAMGSLTLP